MLFTGREYRLIFKLYRKVAIAEIFGTSVEKVLFSGLCDDKLERHDMRSKYDIACFSDVEQLDISVLYDVAVEIQAEQSGAVLAYPIADIHMVSEIA